MSGVCICCPQVCSLWLEECGSLDVSGEDQSSWGRQVVGAVTKGALDRAPGVPFLSPGVPGQRTARSLRGQLTRRGPHSSLSAPSSAG